MVFTFGVSIVTVKEGPDSSCLVTKYTTPLYSSGNETVFGNDMVAVPVTISSNSLSMESEVDVLETRALMFPFVDMFPFDRVDFETPIPPSIRRDPVVTLSELVVPIIRIELFTFNADK
jgi:hypothetical protein